MSSKSSLIQLLEQALMRIVIEVEVEKSFDDKYTAKIDFPIGHFMFTITDAALEV